MLGTAHPSDPSLTHELEELSVAFLPWPDLGFSMCRRSMLLDKEVTLLMFKMRGRTWGHHWGSTGASPNQTDEDGGALKLSSPIQKAAYSFG